VLERAAAAEADPATAAAEQQQRVLAAAQGGPGSPDQQVAKLRAVAQRQKDKIRELQQERIEVRAQGAS
jgi:hypothetical protein